ncbi:Golgi-localized GRIP domain-containing protein isoform 2 [Theobroma cacao]|uniref:Golgi-localized GRIP domain-containing protein isoform 2 n=1 Tax=Theobroma cacao TaxID=3641 RepID=A0A061DL70_THECC|nr:Golgi-localized GRIP domain-containing protein isoform 2 [Theobroma cacao]
MSGEGGEVTQVPETQVDDSLKPEKVLSETNGDLSKENGVIDGNVSSDDTHDQLLQTVTELQFENEFLKSQLKSLKNFQSEHDGPSQQTEASSDETSVSADVKELHERIESLSRELNEEKQTRVAAEQALKHLREVYSEADAKAQELSGKLAEAQQKLDQEVKEREEKYSELDSKFNRLHKRAKQRIQEVQKEKDDLEARLREVNETAERALSQQSGTQQELERTRQQANEALKAMDAERQQLRSANNKLRDNIEELRRSMQPKEDALEALQQSLLEKEQMLEDLQGLLEAADERKQASLAELAAKHQKNMESLEAQLADALSDRTKATETISSLQVLLAEKESKIAEMDAASTGEAARLRAAVESIKGELAHLKHEHEKEKESWEAASKAFKTKLEIAESNCIRAEIEAAKMRSQLELEASVQTQMLSTREAELAAAKEEISRLEREFSSYKIRAHALLQKKDAELAAAKDSEQIKELEEALKETEREVSFISAERDEARQDLQNVLSNHDKELAERDAALDNAKQQIKSLEVNLDSAKARHQSEKVAWEIDLKNLEETWRIRCEALTAENEASSSEDIQKELEETKQRCKRLKDEHASFRDLADRMIEEKDKEISRLLDDNKNLQRSLESRPLADHAGNYNTATQKQDAPNLSTSAAEQQILLLARQQAQREEELAQSQRHILALQQEEIEELERENRLHSQQEAMLKEELRNMERSKRREGVDMTYLKNVILKLLETGEVEALLPVVGMLLQFSPEEMQKCQQAYRTSIDVPASPANEASGSTLSLFSRFSFS